MQTTKNSIFTISLTYIFITRNQKGHFPPAPNEVPKGKPKKTTKNETRVGTFINVAEIGGGKYAICIIDHARCILQCIQPLYCLRGHPFMTSGSDGRMWTGGRGVQPHVDVHTES